MMPPSRTMQTRGVEETIDCPVRNGQSDANLSGWCMLFVHLLSTSTLHLCKTQPINKSRKFYQVNACRSVYHAAISSSLCARLYAVSRTGYAIDIAALFCR